MARQSERFSKIIEGGLFRLEEIRRFGSKKSYERFAIRSGRRYLCRLP
jgi:hypothetical protein